ncbi:MAG: anaerobic ribonucleoside-triphosphate reductase activating protein [Kiritimatiellae bacterium]|nr:anaerobic ribonucleoside-triphosphate reductase activating protein [Kiritimatiellia bacterium]
MNWCEIMKSDIANGEGIRVSLFVAGCTRHCKGCFNPRTWDFDAGHPFTAETEATLLRELAHPWVDGLTLLGGEPMEPANQRVLVPFLRTMKSRLPGKTVWCYTGCVLEQELLAPGYWRTEVTDEFLSMIDVLVDGPFIESLKDISLAFRGSSNQRILRKPFPRKD